jgi:hypothetical protein
MRIAFDSVKDHHALAVIILLIVTSLVVGLIACDGARTYQLTVSSGSGGNVTIPGEGTFTYDRGNLAQLLATPDDGYEFHLWTGDSQHIADPNAGSTTITMNGNYAVVANFETEGGTGPGNGGPAAP